MSSREMCRVVHSQRTGGGQRGQQTGTQALSSNGTEEGQVNGKGSEEKNSWRGEGGGLR